MAKKYLVKLKRSFVYLELCNHFYLIVLFFIFLLLILFRFHLFILILGTLYSIGVMIYSYRIGIVCVLFGGLTLIQIMIKNQIYQQIPYGQIDTEATVVYIENQEKKDKILLKAKGVKYIFYNEKLNNITVGDRIRIRGNLKQGDTN